MEYNLMAYTRQPNSVLAGRALTQTPGPAPIAPAGVLPVALDVDIATTTSLGVVQVGSGLSITPAGILSATGGSGSNFVNVTLTGVSYLITANDSYIGATNNNITITLPLGLLGRVYYIKNQSAGNIKVEGSGGETIDGVAFQTLGSNSGFMVVFDGARWNIL
jgi:hypothetical protein